MSAKPENSGESVDDAVEQLERAKLLLRASKRMGRDLGHMHVVLKPAKFVAYSAPGLTSPVLVFVQVHGPDRTFTIGLRIGKIDVQTPGLSTFILREQAGLVFGRLQLQGEALILEHHLFGTAHARQVAIVAVCLADTAIRLTSELKRLGALIVLDDDEDEDEDEDES